MSEAREDLAALEKVSCRIKIKFEDSADCRNTQDYEEVALETNDGEEDLEY